MLEAVGLVAALVVLLIMFRSMLAAVLPLVSALLGAAGTGATVFLLSAAVDVPGTAPLLALMIGIAVGIDYALFLLSRHREQLADGMDLEESAALATGTAGGAVVFAGVMVVIALLVLVIAGLPFLSLMGVAAAGGVAVLSAITLLPALMGLVGARLRRVAAAGSLVVVAVVVPVPVRGRRPARAAPRRPSCRQPPCARMSRTTSAPTRQPGTRRRRPTDPRVVAGRARGCGRPSGCRR